MDQALNIAAHTTGSAALITQIRPGMTVATVANDGAVAIDWWQVEKVVANPADFDAALVAYARLIVSVRDGTWKPLTKPSK